MGLPRPGRPSACSPAVSTAGSAALFGEPVQQRRGRERQRFLSERAERARLCQGSARSRSRRRMLSRCTRPLVVQAAYRVGGVISLRGRHETALVQSETAYVARMPFMALEASPLDVVQRETERKEFRVLHLDPVEEDGHGDRRPALGGVGIRHGLDCRTGGVPGRQCAGPFHPVRPYRPSPPIPGEPTPRRWRRSPW